MNTQESMMAKEEDDVGAIFQRLAEAKTEEAEGEEGQEKPRVNLWRRMTCLP